MAVRQHEKYLTTADELLELACDGHDYELIAGELTPVSPVVGTSGRLELRVGRIVGNHVEQHGPTETYSSSTGFRSRRDPDTVLSPDVSFIRAGRVPTSEDEDHFIDVIPDLVIEVLSPSNRAGEVNANVLAYLDAGVALVWVMDPKRQPVVVWSSNRTARTLTADDILDGGDVPPGLSMRVGEIRAAHPATHTARSTE